MADPVRGSRSGPATAASTPRHRTQSPWRLLRRPVFRSLWIGSVVANLATWMRDVAGAWLKGVRVNALAPGWFPSEMTAETFGDERSLRWIRGKTPMGRAGREHELDGALLFLASDASTYVTGQTIVVDGGWVVA